MSECEPDTSRYLNINPGCLLTSINQGNSASKMTKIGWHDWFENKWWQNVNLYIPFSPVWKNPEHACPTDAWWCVTLNNSSRRHKRKTKQMKKASRGKRLHFLCQEPLWLALSAQHLWNIPAELCGLFTLDPSQYHLNSGHQDTPILSFSLKVFCYLIPGRGSS